MLSFADLNCSLSWSMLIVQSNSGGLAVSWYCIAFTMSRTSTELVSKLMSKVPWRIWLENLFCSKGPTLAAIGPVAKGVSDACEKCARR